MECRYSRASCVKNTHDCVLFVVHCYPSSQCSSDHTSKLHLLLIRSTLHLRSLHTRSVSRLKADWIRTHNLSRRAAADLRLRPQGHWDRQCTILQCVFTSCIDCRKIYLSMYTWIVELCICCSTTVLMYHIARNEQCKSNSKSIHEKSN